MLEETWFGSPTPWANDDRVILYRRFLIFSDESGELGILCPKGHFPPDKSVKPTLLLPFRPGVDRMLTKK